MTQFGEFVLLEPLQGGRLAEVWKARWLQPITPEAEIVALKILRRELTHAPLQIERFFNEPRATYQLAHPNIATPIKWGIHNGRRFLAVPFIEGHPLSAWTAAQQPLDPAFTLHVLQQVADALHHAHSQGVVHRDVKPNNVLVTPQGKAVLLDFGIALSEEVVRLTQVGELVGTSIYAAPEMLNGGIITAATDVYSLAVMAYEMLTGNPPFQGDKWAVTYQHVYEPVPAASSRNPALEPAVDRILALALDKEPTRRPRSTHSFVHGLAGALRGDLEEQRITDSLRDQIQRPLLPIMLGAGGGVLLILTILALMMMTG